MKFIDLFAGVGGTRLGMERAGHECVWSCEIDKWCQAVYRHHWGQIEAGDARRVDPATIPDHDCLCAGFPCQSFSLAGKRGGFEDARGTLFYEICRIAQAKKPSLLLLENVKGLLSADDRLAFRVVLESLGELGYGAEWQVLNSKGFGVPQNRPRVFVVGHRGGIRGREVFPVTSASGNADEAQGGAQSEGARLRGGYPCVDTRTGSTARGQHFIAEGMRIRRFTPRECERLQGFPDDWTRWGIDEKGNKVEISDTQRYKMMGNAVTVSVVEFIARRLRL